MYLDLNDEQKMLVQTVRRFAEKESPSSKTRKVMESENAFDENLWNQMAEQGWMGLTVPEEYGGLGESALTVAALFEELGKGLVPGPFLATVGLAAPALARAGTAEQKSRWLPMLVEGSIRATVAYLEPAATYELDAIKTTAKTQEGKTLLTGTKMFALDAAIADIILVAAKNNSGEVGLYLVEKGARGLKIENLEGMDLTRRLTRITLDNTPAEQMNGAPDSRKALEEALDYAAFVLSAESVGGMQWMLDTAVGYAKTREQYGRLIGSYQAVSHPLVDRMLDLTSSRSAVYNAAFVLDNQPEESREAVSMAKAQASDSFRSSGYTGVQTLGGIGFTWEHDMQLYFRRAGGSWSLFGDPNWHRERMLKAVNI